MSSYLEVVNAVGDYYGTGSDIWQKIATSGAANLTPEEIHTIRQVPGVNVTVTKSGAFAGWDFDNPFPSSSNPVSDVNSNVPNKTYGGSSFNGRVNGTYHWDGQTARLTSGARNVSTGARVATVAGKLNTAMTAVAAGMFLGAKIDNALYNVGKFFDLNPPESLDPNTWDSLATTEGGKDLIRHLFHIDGNGGSTAYMPEDVLEYMYRYWYEKGLWEVSGMTAEYDGSTAQFPMPSVTSLRVSKTVVLMNNGVPVESNTISGSGVLVSCLDRAGTSLTTIGVAANNTETITRTNLSSGTTRVVNVNSSSTTFNNTPAYTASLGGHYLTDIVDAAALSNPYISSNKQITTIIIDGHIVSNQPIEGANPDPNATQPGNIDPNQPILPQLKQNMPQVFQNPIQETVPQPDGTNKTITYYPVPWPKVTNDTDKPTSGTRDQADPTVSPDDPTDETSPLVDVITNPNPQPTTPTPGEPATPPDTGSGSSPTVVTPTGNASSLWAIYNPTQAQLDAFGSWLWSSNFVEQIKKLFNDPMQAIVGVHKVFATPPTGGQVNIKCGYIDSECPAAQVTGQYVTVNCGTVNVREYYGNVFDYAPYTEISLYLPFIGIVRLDVADVMRGKVTVVYHVDVITGACLADVKVSRDGENSVMYQYSGSAIVTYPISSGSYANMVTGVLSLAAGVAGTIITGGAAAPALIGGAVGLSHLHTDVQKSGGFSGSPGAMGCKKPYLIISRAQDANPADFEKYEGKPASKTVRLGDCSGFVKVKVINIDAVPATYGELDQIVSLLKTGVII